MVDTTAAPRWRKSSFSGNQGNCVEVADNLRDAVAVRDSKDPNGPTLVFSPTSWANFTNGFQNGTSL
ncbi:DUF397 domain-containing protein [Micromonospora sp. DT227]|uniref:DUF397 domain-containing protein n=1 Tax=Micromonospora sp. DT227 TaxID=3393433 RepID=UPI003CEC8F4A